MAREIVDGWRVLRDEDMGITVISESSVPPQKKPDGRKEGRNRLDSRSHTHASLPFIEGGGITNLLYRVHVEDHVALPPSTGRRDAIVRIYGRNTEVHIRSHRETSLHTRPP